MVRINYQWFGWRDVYDVSTAQLQAGEVVLDNDRVWSTPEWGFSIGVRYTMYNVRTSVKRGGKRREKEDKPVILDPKKRQ